MKKDEFFKKCRNHYADSGSELRVVVQKAYRELYPEVALRGAWGKVVDGEFECYVTSQALFTPQHKKDHFTTWQATCEARAVKFRRWLEEWKANNQ